MICIAASRIWPKAIITRKTTIKTEIWKGAEGSGKEPPED